MPLVISAVSRLTSSAVRLRGACNGSAGGVAAPADAAPMMRRGGAGNFVGSGSFKSEDPLKMAKAIVTATTYHDQPDVLAEVSAGLGQAMRGIEIPRIPKEELLATRGW